MKTTTIESALAAMVLLAVSFGAVLLGGCSQPKSVAKMNLTGQLKNINKQVTNLNEKTENLVTVIEALDKKEEQLASSVVLLKQVNEGAGKQMATTEELSGIVKTQKGKVSGVLGIAQQVLAVEGGLKSDTETQLDMTGQTLDLVRALFANLNTFKSVNQTINNKMDRALEIMSNM
jgi:outer membrane murein-binding lipoprotein Lpp